VLLDIGIGRPSQQGLTTNAPAWYHVLFPVSAPLDADLVMQLWLENIARYQVHSDHPYGHWQCAEPIPGCTGSTVPTHVLTCRLQADAGQCQDFAIDVSPRRGATEMAISVQLASAKDPRAENATAQTSLAVAEDPWPDEIATRRWRR